MSNHYHLVLHVDVNDAKTWSYAEIVNRWQRIYHSRPVADRYFANQTVKGIHYSLTEYIKLVDWTGRHPLLTHSLFQRILIRA